MGKGSESEANLKMFGVGGSKMGERFRAAFRRSQQHLDDVPPSETTTAGEHDVVIDYTQGRVLRSGEAALVFASEQEVKTTYNLRAIEPADIDTMIQDEWFKSARRTDHLKGDLINKNTLPKNWDNEDEVSRFKDHLRAFYFPGGEFTVDARDNNGNLIRSAAVERKTLVIEKEIEGVRILAGTTSWLTGAETGDPWSDPADKVMRSHTQNHFVAEDFSGQGLGLALAIARTLAIFEEKDDQGNPKYQEIVTWVNTVGAYQVNEALFESMGYEERGNKVYINTTDPELAVKMRRYVLDRETWENGAVRPDGLRVGRDASIQRWEDKKRGKTHRPPNLG